jgi:hypothetical protein
MWQIDTINGIFCTDGWYIDSNKILINGGYCLIEYIDNVPIPYYFPGSFGAYCLTGTDVNNVFIGGTHLEQNNTYRACLKKWTGTSCEDYFLSDTADKSTSFLNIFRRSNGELWLSSDKSKVYMFDGSSFHDYSFNSYYSIRSPFLKDEFDNLYFPGIVYYGSTGVDSALAEMHKYNGIGWDRIYRKMLYGGGIYFFFQNVGNEIFGVGDNILYKFNGTDFVSVLTVGNIFLMLNGEVSATSLNCLMCKGYDFSSRRDCILNWNGERWSKELTLDDDLYTKFIYTDEKYSFIIIYNYLSQITYIVRGRKMT